MCGIAGFIQKSISKEDATQVVRRMTDRIQHRGPDGSGEWVARSGDWTVALGHRRLSIIDVEGGAQPLGNEDDSIQITFNGEIFNFLELRPELEAAGHRFRTRTDTEVIVHHYEEKGSQGIRDLNGMFALGLWDSKEGELMLSRDRSGIKPLYYSSLDDGGIVFSSELTSLLEHPEVKRHVRSESLSAYFFSDYVHPEETVLERVLKLRPGASVFWKNGNTSDQMLFWDVTEVSQVREDVASEEELKENLVQRLKESVRRQLISDVPVGVFLSGGIDSSLVAALAQEEKGSIQTYSIGFEEKDFDESPFARKVALHLKTDHVEKTLNEKTLLSELNHALDSLDEPMSDPSVVPTYLLSRLASEHVKVVLGGDGGDELWAGYPTYRAFGYGKVYEKFPKFIRRYGVEPLVSRLPVKLTYQSLEWKLKRFALRWDDDRRRRHLRWMSNTDLTGLKQLFNSHYSEPLILDKKDGSTFSDELNSVLALDYQTYLPGSVLTKVDRASMANSLEVRPPFLDNEVIRWSFTTPSRFKLKGQTSKYLLKEVGRGMLPDEILFRKKKGFAIPLGRWLRGPLRLRMDGIFRESPVWDLGMFRREEFKSWMESHQELQADFSRPLWSLLVLDHWARRVL